MASGTQSASILPSQDTPGVLRDMAKSAVEAKVESVVGINIAALQQELINEGIADDSPSPELAMLTGTRGPREVLGLACTGSPQKSQGVGQHFEPMDKSASQTVKLNPKLELTRPDLLKLLSYMEAELQARDVVIATLKTERIKNLLHYGRAGINDPFLALQRDHGGRVFGGCNVSEAELRTIEETQLQQLENLILQQRKAHQRMRQILREAEKRHAWTVEEFDKERRKHEIDAQNDEMADASDDAHSTAESEPERISRRKMERELKKMHETLEEEKGKQKQIILMLVEERKRLALQYAEERKRSEDLAQILSEEKGRIDTMAEGLEEESKKSLQMEAELEKQLAEFDTERRQTKAQLSRQLDRIMELEARAEKLQKEVEHYKKQLQEAHNVAMFQQALSVSPPRLVATTQRAQPPQLPAKPSALTQGQPRLQATPVHSNVTKAVQLTATVNSVPVTGPTTGIARGVQSGVAIRTTMYSSASEVSQPTTTTAKSYREIESSWAGAPIIDCETSLDRSISRISSGDSSLSRGQSQVVQVSPRVNVSASSGSKVITTSHGGKVTFHVTTNAAPNSVAPISSGSVGPPNGQTSGTSGQNKKPLPPTRFSQSASSPITLSSKPVGAPPVPPNKPIVPPKKEPVSGRSTIVESSPISVEVKPQKVGPQTVKFGITISKTSSSAQSACVSAGSDSDSVLSSSRRETTQVEEEGGVPRVHACVDSLSPELENFNQLLNSMADPSDIIAIPSLSSSNSSSLLYTLANCSDSTTPSTNSLTNCSDSTTNSLSFVHQHCANEYVAALLSSEVEEFSLDRHNYETSLLRGRLCASSLSHPPFPLTLTPEWQESASSEATSSPAMINLPRSSPSSSPTPASPSEGYPSNFFVAGSSPPLSLSIDESSDANDLDYSPPDPPHSPIDVATPLTADGMTALHLAAQGNNWQSVGVLIRCGAEVTCEDEEGRTPLYLALLYSCIPAANALLSYPQSMEHTTKAGCNFLHAATKSGEVESVSLLARHILTNCKDGLGLLHLLAASPDHHGHTPLALALAATSTNMAEALSQYGMDLKAFSANNSLLLQVSSPASLSLLSYNEKEEIKCCVWVRGAPLSSELEDTSKWAVGIISVLPSTQWSVLENSIITLLLKHWDALSGHQNGVRFESESSSISDEKVFSVDENAEYILGLTETAIECFCLGNHYWKKGNGNSIHLPYTIVRALQGDCAPEIIVHLHPLAAVSYSCLIPVFLLENYLRLMDQSKCLVVYGAKDSGKRTLARCLAALWCESFSEDSYLKVDLHHSSDESLLISSVEESLRNGCILVLERVPRELWPTLWASLKRGATKRGGRILATMDSWRRPSGQLESEVLWVQLRHDREPLSRFLYRYLIRHISSVSAGHSPSSSTLYKQVIIWTSSSYSRLSDTFMSLGFSSVLRGPHLFIKELRNAFNAKDTVLALQEVWNAILIPAICHEVRNVWRGAPLYGGEKSVDEFRVSAMAIHVIFQRAFVSALDQLPLSLLSGFHCHGKRPTPPPRPKDLPITNGPASGQGKTCESTQSLALSGPSGSPASPEWTQDNLTKMLGLSPMGYA